ncbi:hypothetical protein BBO01nite_45390 [Brevibacillus borstelensis]|nr:hypothetical protein BBO01nite_45390 [Brevibacillus borstelensis]
MMVRSWRNYWDEIATFFTYLPEIRKLIYTINVVEGFIGNFEKLRRKK